MGVTVATLTSTLQTEANAGEYDVPQCAPGTPAHLCVHEITAHFKVSDMMQVRMAKYYFIQKSEINNNLYDNRTAISAPTLTAGARTSRSTRGWS